MHPKVMEHWNTAKGHITNTALGSVGKKWLDSDKPFSKASLDALNNDFWATRRPFATQGSPDMISYLAANPPSPFHMRVLMPALCGKNEADPFIPTVENFKRWRIGTCVGIGATALGIYGMAGGWKGVAAGALFLTLPVNRFNLEFPILVDAMALGLATCSAALYMRGWKVPATLVVLAAGATKETSPVFASLFAQSPVLLVGLAAPLVISKLRTPGTDMAPVQVEVLAHPVAIAKKHHNRFLVDANPMLITPWGASVVALGAPSFKLYSTLAVAYGQLLIATDVMRLYQWAAPVVCIAAVSAVDKKWWPLLIAATAFNPFREATPIAKWVW